MATCRECNGSGEKAYFSGSLLRSEIFQCEHCNGTGAEPDSGSGGSLLGCLLVVGALIAGVLFALTLSSFTPAHAVADITLERDTLQPPRVWPEYFMFNSTTQFLIQKTGVQEAHKDFDVFGIGELFQFGRIAENEMPRSFRGFEYVVVNDSTIVGECRDNGLVVRRVEWQRRNGEQAVWLTGPDYQFRLYEFYRDLQTEEKLEYERQKH